MRWCGVYRDWISPQRWLERLGLRAPTQIVVGLALLTACVFLFAQDLNLLPDDRQQLIKARTSLAETTARSLAAYVSREDYAAVSDQLNALVGHDNCLSAALRLSDGTVVAQTPDHNRYWAGGPAGPSDPAHVDLTLFSRQKPWGSLQITFAAGPHQTGWRAWWSSYTIRLIIFVIGSQFLLFFFYLSRMLRVLDPSAAIPNRMQLLMDTLVEGMVVLDNDGVIVMANQAIAKTAFSSAEQLVGRKLSSLPWLSADAGGGPVACPWENETLGDLQLRDVPMTLGIGARHTRRLNVNVSPICSPEGNHLGTLVTFDDQTILQQDNLQLVRFLAKFGNVDDQLRQLRLELPPQSQNHLDQLEELARTARELAQVSAATAGNNGADQERQEISQIPITTGKEISDSGS